MYKYIFLVMLSSCAFSKSDEKQKQSLAQNEYALTIDWLMQDETRPEAVLKAVRPVSVSGETYLANAPTTLPAAVPQSLILRGDFSASQIPEVNFLRGSIKLSEKSVFVPVQIVGEESINGKKRLTFQVTGLNAAFRTESSNSGLLHIEIFGRTQRLAILEVPVRTPPSDLKSEEVPIKTWETQQSQGDMSEYLRPVIAGKQINLLKVLKYSSSEILPVQIQVPRRIKGTFNQSVNQYSYYQNSACSIGRSDTPSEEVLSSDIIILPLNESFITEAERSVQSPEVFGAMSSTLEAGNEINFGIYAVGEKADQWMTSGPPTSESWQQTFTVGCERICIKRECEPTPGPRTIMSDTGITLMGCQCADWGNRPIKQGVTVGIERLSTNLTVPIEFTKIPLRFADLDPNQDGEIRFLPILTEKSEVSWLR